MVAHLQAQEHRLETLFIVDLVSSGVLNCLRLYAGQNILDLPKFNAEIVHCFRKRLLDCQCAVEVVYSTEMITINLSNYGKLVIRYTRCRTNIACQVVVANCGTPISAFMDKLCLSPSGKVT